MQIHPTHLTLYFFIPILSKYHLIIIIFLNLYQLLFLHTPHYQFLFLNCTSHTHFPLPLPLPLPSPPPTKPQSHRTSHTHLTHWSRRAKRKVQESCPLHFLLRMSNFLRDQMVSNELGFEGSTFMPMPFGLENKGEERGRLGFRCQ